MEQRSNHQTYTEELESYNEAVRYAEEDERRQAYNEAYYRVNGRPELFKKIKDRTESKLSEIEAAAYDKSLTEHVYTDFLEQFNRDKNELSVYGELNAERKIWIKEIEEKLIKFYLMYLKNEEETFIKKNLSKYVDRIYICAIERMEKTWPELAKFLKSQKKTNKTRSKVCRLANKIERSISRKEAFSIAWQIVKNGGLEIKVAGVSFYNRQEALRRLTTYEPRKIHAFLIPEYENQYDANAIAVEVMVQGGKGVYRIGYVPKTETAIVKAFLGTVPELKVLDGDIRSAKVRLAA